MCRMTPGQFRTRLSGQGGHRLFRILGYGTIVVLIVVLLFARWLEPPNWSQAAADRLAGTVSVMVLISLAALLFLYLVRRPDFFETAILSAPSARWIRRVRVASLISLVLALGAAFFLQRIVGIFLALPFWLPLLLSVIYLYSNTPKIGLALSVAMGLCLSLGFGSWFSVERDWESAGWIQISLVLAALLQLTLAAAAIRTYYSLPNEPRDLGKLLWSLAYGFLLLNMVFVSTPFEDKETLHDKMARNRLASINHAASAYAKRFGGVFPESLGVLGPPSPGQEANCRAAGLLDRSFDKSSGGYHVEYQSGAAATAFTGSCGGAKSYSVSVRPMVYGKTGSLNMYTDETGRIRCIREDRPANASDVGSCYFARFSPSGPPSSGRPTL